MKIIIMLLIALLGASSVQASPFQITSPRFGNNSTIPVYYTCNGNNVPPALVWTNAPANTHAFAIVMTNPDSAVGRPFYNWIIFNIPPKTTSIQEGKKLPEGTLVGDNTYGEASYAGPCPENASVHRYNIVIYALDATVDLPADASAEDVMNEVKEHVIQQAAISGTFQH